MKMIDCIVDTSKKENIQIFGMQKCGSGTISRYCSLFDNLIWHGHGCFLREDLISKSSYPNPGVVNDRYSNRQGGPWSSFKIHDSKISIGIIRNPYDLLLSFYFHSSAGSNNVAKYYEHGPQRNSTIEGFKKFIMSLEDIGRNKFPLFNLSCFYPYYDEAGNFKADYALKLSAINKIIELRGGWSDRVGRSTIESLEHKSNKPELPMEKIYDIGMIEVIKSKFCYELETFGYKFKQSDDRIIISRSDIPDLSTSKIDNFHRSLSRRGGY